MPLYRKEISSDVLRACMLLGLAKEEITETAVFDAWKAALIKLHRSQMSQDEQMDAVNELNNAKGTIILWLA